MTAAPVLDERPDPPSTVAAPDPAPVAPHPPAAGRPQLAQRVWQRAQEVPDPVDHHELCDLALDLLRVGGDQPTMMAHALTIGRTYQREHDEDETVRLGVRNLARAITFLGVKPSSRTSAGPDRAALAI